MFIPSVFVGVPKAVSTTAVPCVLVLMRTVLLDRPVPVQCNLDTIALVVCSIMILAPSVSVVARVSVLLAMPVPMASVAIVSLDLPLGLCLAPLPVSSVPLDPISPVLE